MQFNKGHKSPVTQDLMYLAEYGDGSYVTEYDLITKASNPFDYLKRVGLMRFGLVGVSMPLYIETYGGFFHIAGRNIQVKYVVGDEEYHLIGGRKTYSNVHYFKTGRANLNMRPTDVMWGNNTGSIVSYHLGYEESLDIKDKNFRFRAECVVPYQEKVYIKFKVQSGEDMDGKFVIIVNGSEVFKEDAPITAEMGGEVHWEVV